MEISELLLALLSICPEGIDGRTAIQKLGYLASVSMKMEAGYNADLYGPYSTLVASQLQTLVELDFVVERARRTVRNRTMYNYGLTADGRSFAVKVQRKFPREHSIIRRVVRKCNQIVHCNFLSLSWAAKVHFVLKQNDRAMTYDEAINASKSFGWELQKDQVEAGARLLTSLKLIETGIERVRR
jgi:uncharacterized protein YwgA